MEVHQLVQFVQVQEVHQYQEVVHVHNEEAAWEGRSRCCGAGPVMQRFMGGGRKYSKAAIGPGSQWLANPIYTPPEHPPPVDSIRQMECPLRTVAKHLSRVSRRSLDRSSSAARSASSSSFQDSVRVTGEEGLVWSCNPVFADEQGVPWGLGPEGGVPPSRHPARLSSRISRTSRISSAFDAELSPLPRIKTSHERELTDDSAKELATGALSGVSPVVSGFMSSRDPRDFDSANMSYMADWLCPDDLRSRALRLSPRPAGRQGGVHAGPGRDSCMDELIHRLEESSWSKIGKLRSDIEDKQGEIASLIDAVSDGTSQRRKIRSFPLPDALAQIHELREMIQQMDCVIAKLYQDIAREIAALAKMGNAMKTPRASVPWHVSGAQAMTPWPMSSGAVRKQRLSSGSRRRSIKGPPRQDSLEGETLSRLEVQVQVLAEQLHVLQDKVRDQKMRRSAGHRSEHAAAKHKSDRRASRKRAEIPAAKNGPPADEAAVRPAIAVADSADRPLEPFAEVQVVVSAEEEDEVAAEEEEEIAADGSGDAGIAEGGSTPRSAASSDGADAASVVERGSDASDVSGTYEIVLNPFFDDGDNPIFEDDVDDARMPPLFDGCWRQERFWPTGGQFDSIAALQALVAESDAEIARLTAEIGGGVGYYAPVYYAAEPVGVAGFMHRNPVFDGQGPYEQGVVVV
eukprot:evm.model.scf_37.1 EVM.evm.TU.scf_37.1   scf_37:1957-5610(-)